MADWELCGQCARKFWTGDSYKSVPPPPRLPHESLTRFLLRATFHSIRRTAIAVWSRSWVGLCEKCSAKNDDGWKAHERFVKQKARLASIEAMLAGLGQQLPSEDQLEHDWDARRAELIKDLEAQRAAILEDL